MRIGAIVHKAKEGGFWAEIPGIEGCHTQADDIETLRENLKEVAELCLAGALQVRKIAKDSFVMDLDV